MRKYYEQMPKKRKLFQQRSLVSEKIFPKKKNFLDKLSKLLQHKQQLIENTGGIITPTDEGCKRYTCVCA